MITFTSEGKITIEVDGNVGVIKPQEWLSPSGYGNHWLCTACGHHWEATEISDCPECGNKAAD